MTPSNATPEDALQGTPYRALSVLGAGAMGEVFLAEHIALKKRVVVKLLRASLASSASMVDRMRLEAQAIAHLRHPNIVAGHDFGSTADGRAYIVMESLEGRTLTDEVKKRGPLPYAEACDIVRQVLTGLAEAHLAGILHRDLKPGNLFLCEPDRDGKRVAKILDFGIAKILPSAGPDAPAPLALPTAQGVAIGSPRYFSPEQARGRKAEPRSDLYSMGAVLYFLLTARDPFRHRLGAQVLLAHANEAPRPPSLTAPAQSIPRALDRVVLRALAKRPEERFANADAFALALEVATRPAPSSSASRWPSTEVINVETLRLARESRRRAPKNGTMPIDVDELRRERERLAKNTDDVETSLDEATNVLPRAPDPASPWVDERAPQKRDRDRLVNWMLAAALLFVAVSFVFLFRWIGR